jgi:ectoine hydroxylase-related dioxygenase (phytanoyl-CoA dioxygenase family)
MVLRGFFLTMKFYELDKKGFVIVKDILDENKVLHLIESLSKLKSKKGVSKKKDLIYGVRNLLNLSPEIKEFAESKTVKEIVENFIGKDAKLVRAIYFDKTPNANWKVPWHQDLTISVEEKIETSGFTAWTLKAEIQHVQPTVEILENILTLRFHLDDADESNGALKVLEESHKSGRLESSEIQNLKDKANSFLCEASKGDVLVMRPLLVHSSSAGSNPKNRRVIHLEFSAEKLPNGLKWYGS